MSSVYDIKSDPKKTGPGMWLTIHILAFHSTTKDSQKIFCSAIRIICSNIPCSNCRQHALDYIESNPPEKYVSEDSKSIFKWSCDFHNNVNKRTNSIILDSDILYQKYKENSLGSNGLPLLLGESYLEFDPFSANAEKGRNKGPDFTNAESGQNNMNINQRYNDSIFNRITSNMKKKK